MAFFVLLLATALAQPEQSARREKEEAGQDLVVTGQRPDPRETTAEEPWETTPRVMLGSRIARKPGGRRVFNTVATESGLAGLLAGNQQNFDATGGSAPAFSKRHVKTCKAQKGELDEVAACALLGARRKMDAGEYTAASALLTPLLQSERGWERYHAGHLAYLLAERSADEAGRERALTAMLQSGKMAAADRAAAMKTLVAMALRRGDEAAAITRLESLVHAAPEDARSLANLAALHAGRGDHERARPLMLSAVAVIRSKGGNPPPSWTDYLTRPR